MNDVIEPEQKETEEIDEDKDSPVETHIVANYTISPPSRRLLNKKLDIRHHEAAEKDEDITATFTIASSPTSKTSSFKIIPDELSSNNEEEPIITTSITATINVPISKDKKTESPPTSPKHQKSASAVQRRSLFDIDNDTSIKLAEKLQEEAKKCDSDYVQSISSGDSRESSIEPPSISTATSESASTVLDEKPNSPSPSNLGERRPSWRLKSDLGKVIFRISLRLYPVPCCT